jgi:hypothetical protein
MARSWTRLHEYLGQAPGPITYEMVAQAAAAQLDETDDLDWKEHLPSFAPKAGVWNEFAKDVAAMANTRGGLLIYGVRDSDKKLVGINLQDVNEQQMLQSVRTRIQPYISGVDLIPLPAPGGSGPDVLVVDVPASELAPHFQYGWQDKDKDRATFNAPYRVRDHTAYMAEHQIARAYQDRSARQSAADTRLRTYLTDAADAVLNASDALSAWLVIASLPARPVPRLVPAPDRLQAKETFTEAVGLAAPWNANRFRRPSVLRDVLDNNMQVGLRRWIDSNLARQDRVRGATVELHHDGAVTVCVNLSWALGGIDGAMGGGVVGAPVDVRVMSSAVYEAIALIETSRRRRAADTPVDVTALISATRPGPLIAADFRGGFPPSVFEGARAPWTILPASTELPPVSDEETLRACANELDSGLLNQFGLETQSV